jgi:hypothetical protein
MSAINIKGTRSIVLYFLESYDRLRDSDEKLIATIWKLELVKNKIDPKKITAFNFLQLFADGKLTNPESIRRSRAKIQENIPELRGVNYKDRQGKSYDVQDELRNFFDDEEKGKDKGKDKESDTNEDKTED